jgi:histidinol-phosphate aminotransferase
MPPLHFSAVAVRRASITRVRDLPAAFRPYGWALSTAEIARRAGIDVRDVLRFDGNTPPNPPPYARADTVRDALEQVNRYPHGGFPALLDAIAEYAGVEPAQIVLGAGADDLILLVARAYAGPGDVVRVLDEPTYPLLRISAWLAGADVGENEAVVTFACRPHNPTGALGPIPNARPLIVDEAYHEYADDSAIGLDGVIVIRTFSKAFALAGARVGYAIADAETARELRLRNAPGSVSNVSAALALAALRDPPGVAETIAERDRLASLLRELGLDPLPSHTNFLYVPIDDAHGTYDRLLGQGLVVRPFEGAIRITVHTREANERLAAALEQRDG